MNQINNTLKEINKLDDQKHAAFKKEQIDLIRNKLYRMGVIDSKTEGLPKVSIEKLCNRRISYLCYKLNFAENVKFTSAYISQGRNYLLINNQI